MGDVRRINEILENIINTVSGKSNTLADKMLWKLIGRTGGAKRRLRRRLLYRKHNPK